MAGRVQKVITVGPGQGHLLKFHVGSKVSTRQPCGQVLQTLSRNITCWVASLKYTHSMGNKHKEFEIWVKLQGYDFVEITDMWWDVSHDWSVVLEGYRLFKKDRKMIRKNCPLCKREAEVHGALPVDRS